MERIEFYDKINPCGNLTYESMVYMIQNLYYQDVQVSYALTKRISQTGKLTKQDWILLAKAIVFSDGSPIDANTVIGWLEHKCNLTRDELKLFLEYAHFIPGSEPTYIMSQGGDFIIAE